MIEQLIAFFKKSKEETKEQTPEGVCPNCWGKQEYDNVIRDLYEDHQIDVNNHQSNHAFIKKFVVDRMEGIRLIKGNDGFACPTCRMKDE